MESTNNENNLTGIKGWLVFLSIGLVLTPIHLLKNIFGSFGNYSDFIFLNTFIILGDIVLLAMSVLVIFLFFNKKKEAPETIMKWILLNLLFSFIVFIFGIPFISNMNAQSQAIVVATLPVNLISAFIWISYLRLSKRVKATFIEETTEDHFKDVLNYLNKVNLPSWFSEEGDGDGIRGWLIIPGILLFLFPLIYILLFLFVGIAIKQFLINLILMIPVISLSVISGIKFFKRKIDAPQFMKIFLITFPVIYLTGAIVSVVYDVYNYRAYVFAAFYLIVGIPFFIYFFKSKRVKETFTNEISDKYFKPLNYFRKGFIVFLTLYSVSIISYNLLNKISNSMVNNAVMTDDTEKLSLPLLFGIDKNRGDLLLIALKNNNWKVAEILVENGIGLNYNSGKSYKTLSFRSQHSSQYGKPILIAIDKNKKDFIKLLVKKGELVDQKDLVHVINKNNLDLLNFLIEECKITDQNLLNSLLDYSIANGKINTARYLIKKGATVNIVAATSNAKKYFNTIADLLLKGFVDITKEDLNKHLMKAVNKMHIETIEFLIDKGADANVKIGYKNETLLHIAAAKNSVKLTKFLIKKKLKHNMKNSNGVTPVDIAINSKNPYIVKIFLENGASIKTENKNKLLFMAAGNRDKEFLEYLISKKFKVNIVDKTTGKSLLHIASSNGSIEIVKILLENGINVNISDNNKRTSLFDAIEKLQTESIKVLIEKGAKSDLKDINNISPMNIAQKIQVEKYRTEIISLLNKK